MTHKFTYPKVTPAPDGAPETDSGGPAGPAGPHNDTAGGPPSRAAKEQERPAPETGRAAPLRADDASPARSGGADERG